MDRHDLPAPALFDPSPRDGASLRVRTVWISDLHLGTPGCRADALLDFLKQVDCDQLYLVGDIIDGWQLRRSWYWPQSHNDVVQKLLRKARKRGADGVVCGHIHHAEMREIDGVLYCNDGDWVESLTALVEHPDGRLEILDWSGRDAGRGRRVPAVEAPGAAVPEPELALLTRVLGGIRA